MGLVCCSSGEPSAPRRARSRRSRHPKLSPKRAGSVCVPATRAITHKHKQLFFMWSRVNLLTSAVVCNTVRVNQCLHRWGNGPFIILWFVFLSWHSVPHSLPGVMRNVLSAPSRQGACHSMEGCHKNVLKPAKEKPAPEWWFIHTKECYWHKEAWKPVLKPFPLFPHFSFSLLRAFLILSPGGPKEGA